MWDLGRSRPGDESLAYRVEMFQTGDMRWCALQIVVFGLVTWGCRARFDCDWWVCIVDGGLGAYLVTLGVTPFIALFQSPHLPLYQRDESNPPSPEPDKALLSGKDLPLMEMERRRPLGLASQERPWLY